LPSNEDSQTFPDFRRLRSSEEFRRALNAYFCSKKWFVIYVTENKAGISRLGIIISKRLMHHSTNRNYVKRLVRETFRQNFPVDLALDVVVRIRRPLGRESSHEGRGMLVQLLGDVQSDASVLN
jgi:ribonuclease P protein component